jgi:hypothetical protein
MRRRTIPGPGKFESIQQLRERAESGDFGGLLDFLGGPGNSVTVPEDRERILRRCVQEAGRNGMPEFLDGLIEHLIKHDTRLLLQSQADARRLEGKTDHGLAGTASVYPRHYDELEHAGRLADRILATAQVYARLKHVLALGSREKATREKVIQMPLSDYAQEAVGG